MTTNEGALARLRQDHRRAVVQALGASGPASRAELARRIGLSRTTVSGLVAELIADGVACETGVTGRPHKGGSGRPPVLVALRAAPGVVAGVDVGHGHLRVVVADAEGVPLAEALEVLDVDARGVATLDRAAAVVGRLVREADAGALSTVGVCVPAPLDRRSRRVSTGVLPGWLGVAPGPELERRLGVPVEVDNDANLGALAEVTRGAGRDVDDVVYLKHSGGLGAGIVLGRRLHRGSTGQAGEIGHVQIGEDGPVCRCGNRGCLETLVAAPRLLGLLQPAHDEVLDVPALLALDAAGDAGVRRVLGDAGHLIGRAVADLANCLNPALVVLGGALGAAASVRAGVERALERYAQPDTAAALRVVGGQLGERAEVVGAVALAVAAGTAAAV